MEKTTCKKCNTHFFLCSCKEGQEKVDEARQKYQCEYDKHRHILPSSIQPARLGVHDTTIFALSTMIRTAIKTNLDLSKIKQIPKGNPSTKKNKSLAHILCFQNGLQKQEVEPLNHDTKEHMYTGKNVQLRTDEQTILTMFNIIAEDGTPLQMIHDTGCTELVLEDGIPGYKLHSAKLPEQNVEVAGGNTILTSGYSVLLRNKEINPFKYLEAHATLLPSIIKDLELMDITDLMDSVYTEYKNNCTQQNQLIKWKRHQLPNVYGGHVSGLMGNRYCTLQVEIENRNHGITLFSTPFKSGNIEMLAVGGSIPDNFITQSRALVISTREQDNDKRDIIAELVSTPENQEPPVASSYTTTALTSQNAS